MMTQAPPSMIVSCQQTRFHIIEDNASKEIEVKGLDLVIANQPLEGTSKTEAKKKAKAKAGGVEILSGADLRLKSGVRYALVGPNGSGKSTLLKALADNRIPGIPDTTKIAILQQIAESQGPAESDDKALKGPSETGSETVIGKVTEADPQRARLVRELRELSEAIDSNDPTAPVKALRKRRFERLEGEYFAARKDAQLRSGARGLDARKALICCEKKYEESSRQLNMEETDLDAIAIEAGTKEAVKLQTSLQTSLDAASLLDVQAKARTVLLGLGFREAQFAESFSQLSGGWRMRCLLAAALTQISDVLILDEPTNFLDLLGILWLQRYLALLGPETTVLLVSHDRDFVNAACEELIIIQDRSLKYFAGNLDAYEKSLRHEKLRIARIKDAQDRQIAHMSKTVAASIKQGRKTGDDSKLRQAKSRQKKLDERMGMQVSTKGTRFKLNRDMVGFYNHSHKAIEVPQEGKGVKMVFPDAPNLRYPGSLISLDKATFAYSKTAKPVFQNADLVIHMGDRIGLLGLNGAGKSTLVQLLIGNHQPSKGSVTHHPRLKVAYYSQHTVKALKNLGLCRPNCTALTLLMEKALEVANESSEQSARKLLGSLGLPGRTASDTPIATLSGGQLARLALASLFVDPPHLFVLDEPTTHLDFPTVTAMTRALQEYHGAVVIVTHDRFFMRCVVEGEDVDADDSDQESVEEAPSLDRTGPGRRLIYEVKAGKVSLNIGGMDAWENGLEGRLRKLLL